MRTTGLSTVQLQGASLRQQLMAGVWLLTAGYGLLAAAGCWLFRNIYTRYSAVVQVCSLPHAVTHSLPHSLTLASTLSLTHAVIHAVTHAVTHSRCHSE